MSHNKRLNPDLISLISISHKGTGSDHLFKNICLLLLPGNFLVISYCHKEISNIYLFAPAYTISFAQHVEIYLCLQITGRAQHVSTLWREPGNFWPYTVITFWHKELREPIQKLSQRGRKRLNSFQASGKCLVWSAQAQPVGMYEICG